MPKKCYLNNVSFSIQPSEEGWVRRLNVIATFSEEPVDEPTIVIHDDPKNPFPNGFAIVDLGVAVIRWGNNLIPPLTAGGGVQLLDDVRIGVGDEKI